MPGIEELMALMGGGAPGGMPGQGGRPSGMPSNGMPSQQSGIPPQLQQILGALEQVGAQAAVQQHRGGGGKMNELATRPRDGRIEELSEPMGEDLDMRSSSQTHPNEQAMRSRGQAEPSDEAMLAAVQKQMGADTGDPDAGGGELPHWEGEEDGVPTARDQAMLDTEPSDAVIADFIQRFPTWSDQHNISQGGSGLAGEDVPYVMDEDSTGEIYKDRKTKIDER